MGSKTWRSGSHRHHDLKDGHKRVETFTGDSEAGKVFSVTKTVREQDAPDVLPRFMAIGENAGEFALSPMEFVTKSTVDAKAYESSLQAMNDPKFVADLGTVLKENNMLGVLGVGLSSKLDPNMMELEETAGDNNVVKLANRGEGAEEESTQVLWVVRPSDGTSQLGPRWCFMCSRVCSVRRHG